MPTALITGASAGLGAEFARQLAAAGNDLILVARSADRLAEQAEKLHAEYGVTVDVLPADLADAAARSRVELWLSEKPVDVLVNNAGFGTTGRFADVDIERLQTQVDLHVSAVLRLTHAALPGMLERGDGTIINVSSIAGILPQSGATYGASKAWVIAFSEGLASVLADRGVTIQALCPGFTHTEFHQRSGDDKSKIPSRLWLNAEQVVRESLADAAAGKVVSIPSKRWKAIVVALKLMPPGLRRKLGGKLAARRGRT